jgi:uncharacterized glyoxalase superfamily protein PhnB
MSTESLIGRPLAVSLTVKDIQKSLTYYQDTLGFSIERTLEREGVLRSVALKAGDVSISINQDDGAKGWERVKGEGFSLRITTEQNIDELADRIKKSGGILDSDPADMPWGTRAFRFRDPDGYKFMISSPRPA